MSWPSRKSTTSRWTEPLTRTSYCPPQTLASGRPQLTPWILGEIASRHHPSIAGKWQARGRYRDANGKRFDVTARGDSPAKSKRALQAKVEQHRTTHRGGDATLNQDTTVARSAELWLESAKRKRVRGKPLAPRTIEQYEGNVRRYIGGNAIATRKLALVDNVSVIEQWLAGIADNHGNGAAQAARKVLSNTLAHAERQGAIAASVMAVSARRARMSERRATASAPTRTATRTAASDIWTRNGRSPRPKCGACSAWPGPPTSPTSRTCCDSCSAPAFGFARHSRESLGTTSTSLSGRFAFAAPRPQPLTGR